LVLALKKVLTDDVELYSILKSKIAAVSVGWHNDQILLDLNYDEDSTTDADLNVVMNNEPALIEVQGTAERGSIPRAIFIRMLDLAQDGITELIEQQEDCLRSQGIEL
jgi:ribonuclease PH